LPHEHWGATAIAHLRLNGNQTVLVYAHVLRQHAAGVANVFATAIEPGDDATSAADKGAFQTLAGPPVSKAVSKPRS
jgi:hypothetical protein